MRKRKASSPPGTTGQGDGLPPPWQVRRRWQAGRLDREWRRLRRDSARASRGVDRRARRLARQETRGLRQSRWARLLDRRAARRLARREQRAARRIATPRRHADRPPVLRSLASRMRRTEPGGRGEARPLDDGPWDRRRPSLTIRTGLAAVLLGGVSGLGAVAADVSPTADPAADVAWTLALAVAVAVAGALARRGVLAVAAVVATVGAWGWWSLAGILGLLLVATTRDPIRRLPPWLLHALSASLTLQALVRMPGWSWMPFGSTALVAAAVVGVVILNGWFRSPPAVRTSTGVAVVGSVVALLIVGTPIWRTVGSAELTDSANLAAAGTVERRDQLDASAEDIAVARRQLDDVQRDLSSPLAAPFRFIPVAAQQLRALDTSVAVALDLLDQAGAGVAAVNDEALRPGPGQVDVNRVRDLKGPLTALRTSLQTAQPPLAAADSGWLFGRTLTVTRTLIATIDEALPATDLALLGVEAVPLMLGADEPQRWLIQLVDPDQGRSQWQVAVAVDGRLIATDEQGEGEGVGVPATERIDMVDFPAAARTAAERFESATGERIDVVVRLDPIGATAIIASDGTPVASLVRSPQEFLEALASSRPAAPSDWARQLVTPFREQRLLIWSATPSAELFLSELRLLRER